MERMKNNRNLAVGVALVLVMIALVGVFAAVGIQKIDRLANADPEQGEQQNVPEGAELWVAGVDILAAGTVTTETAGVTNGTATARYDEEFYVFILTLDNFVYSGDGCDGSVIYFKGADNDGCNRLQIQVLGENSFYSSSHIAAGMITLATPHAQLFIDGDIGNGTGSLSLSGNHFGILTAGANTTIGVYEVTLLIESDVYAINMTGDNNYIDDNEEASLSLQGYTRAINGGNMALSKDGQAWDHPQHDPVALIANNYYTSQDLSSYIKITATAIASSQGYDTLAVTLDEDYIDAAPWDDLTDIPLAMNFPTSEQLVFDPEFTFTIDSEDNSAMLQPMPSQKTLVIMIREDAGVNAMLEALFNKGADLAVTLNNNATTYDANSFDSGSVTDYYHMYVSDFGIINIVFTDYVDNTNRADTYSLWIYISREAQGGGQGGEQEGFPEGIELYVAGVDILAAGTVTTANEGTATVRYDEENLIFNVNLENFVYSGDGYNGSAIYFKGNEYCNRLSISANGENILTCPSNNDAGMIYLATPGANLFLYGSVSGDGVLYLNGNDYGIKTANGENMTSISAGGNLILCVESNVYAVNMTNDNDSFDFYSTAAVTLLGNTKAINGNNLCFHNGGQAWEDLQQDPVALEANKGYNSEDISSYIKIVTTSNQSSEQGQGGQDTSNGLPVVELLADDIDPQRTTCLVEGDIAAFQAMTFEEAQAWTGAPEGMSLLLYAVNENKTFRGCIFMNGIYQSSFDEFSQACNTLHNELVNGYSRVFFTCSQGGSSGVEFTKVESVDQIAAENIEECTFDQVKAWIVAHWGDITATDQDFSYVVYSNGTDLQSITISAWESAEDFENGVSPSTVSIEDCKGNYGYGFDLYLCTNGASGGGQQSEEPVTVYFTQLQTGDHISAGTRIMYDEYDYAPFMVFIDGGLTEQLVDSSGETPYFELQEDVTVALIESYDDHYLFLLSGPVLPEGVLYIAGVDVATIEVGGTIDAQTEGAVGILSGSVTVEFVDTWYCNVSISFNNFVYQGEGYTAGDGISAAIHHTGIERLLIRYNGQNSLTVTGENAYGIYSGNPKGRIELIGASGESTDSFSISAENGYGIGGEIGEKSYIVIGGNMTVSGKIGANMEQLDVYNPYGGSVTIIGTEQAVLNKVRSNDLTGTGWTDTAGTQGETSISATEMGSVEVPQYKRLQFTGTTGQGGQGQGGGSGSGDPTPAMHTHNDITFTAWEFATSLPSEAGNYYLTVDVTISSTWTVPSGTTNLCLNGHSITMTGSGNVICVFDDKTLNLYDCDTETEHKYSIADPTSNGAGLATVNDALTENYQTFVGGYITGGNVAGNDNTLGGGGIGVQSGTLVVNGGTVIGNNSTVKKGGGGVCVYNGTFTLNGGAIIGNKANYGSGAQGGGVSLLGSGRFYMNGGAIERNESNGCGGGIQSNNSNGETVITGGAIRNNYAAVQGGGINSGISVTFSGGTISGNAAPGRSGGGYFGQGITLSGDATIQNNTGANGRADDICLHADTRIVLQAPLSANNVAKIAVSKYQSDLFVATSGWSTYMSGKDPADYLVARDKKYAVSLQDNEAAVVIGDQVHDGITFKAWTLTNSLPTTAGSYYLFNDVTISSTWTVPSGTTNLCLNGHGIKMTGSGSVVSIGSGCALGLYDCEDTVHCFDVNGNSCATNLNDVSGNYCLRGGYVTGGNAFYGGGIYVNGGTFEMHGGTILGNSVDASGNAGGGVYLSGGAEATMYGGMICYNYAQNVGAGVYVNHATFTMLGGVISYNKTNWSGGSGVALHNDNSAPVSVFNMFGGVIEHNNSKNNYGAVDLRTGLNTQFNVKGNAVIRNNYSETESNVHNVTLRSDYGTLAQINIVGALQGAEIGVALNGGTGVLTSGWSDYMEGEDPSDYFVSDAEGLYFILNQDGEVEITDEAPPMPHVHDGVTFTAWESTNSLPLEAGNYYLYYDVTLSSTWTAPTGTTNLCLNGHGIKWAGQAGYYSIIEVHNNNTLNLYDCGNTVHYFDIDEGKTLFAINVDEIEGPERESFTGGYITGGNRSYGAGGAIWVENATFNMYGGTILGNTAGSGGGVYVSESGSVFNVYGGRIMYNNATGSNGGGGAVRVNYGPTFTLSGGEILYNYASNYGGGVAIYDSSTFNLFGGEIYANSAAQSGGGVYIANSYITVGISGNPIVRDNFANSVKDNFYTCGGKLNFTGELTSGASVGVTMNSGTGVFTSGWTTNMNGATPADYFSSDNAGYSVYLLDGEAAILAEAPISAHEHNDITFTAWEFATSLPNEAGNYYLTADVTISSTWNVPSGITNLCLNGHVISAASNVCISVITIQNGSTLNLYDCDTTTHYYYVDASTYKQNRASNRDKMYDIGEIAADGPTNARYVAATKKGTFKGGYITGGTGQGLTSNSNNISGGGFQIYGGGTLNMYGGCVFGNYTSATSSQGNEGGGVYVYQNGVFNMNGGYIIGNQGGNACGGVQNLGTFTMNDGYIGHNTAGDGGWANGGGVGNSGTMTMNGGVIEGNEAGGNGGLRGKCGGAIENNGSLTINGGFIINNFCDNLGGGIYMSSASASLTIGASATITGNYNDITKKADNVYLGQNKMITLGSALTENNSVGVTLKSGEGTFTSGWSTHMEGKDPADYFVSDNADYQVYLLDGEAAILDEAPTVASVTDGETVTKYTSFADALAAWTNGTTLTLLANVTSDRIESTGGGTKTLDLNGKTITLVASNVIEQRILCVTGTGTTLNLIDSSGTNAGRLTGVNPGSGDDGWSGAIYINSGSIVNMYGGTITGNASTRGAGVWIDGRGHGGSATFNMYGGLITGNESINPGSQTNASYSPDGGAGVFVGAFLGTADVGTGRFNMYGGTITGNEGGNVYVDHGVMTMTGGTINGGVSHSSNSSDYVAVTFDANDGTGTMSVQYVKIGTDTKVKDNEYYDLSAVKGDGFAREGYNLVGWNTQANGLGTSYTAGVSNINFSEATTLYAQWESNSQGGQGSDEPHEVTLGEGKLYVGGVDIVAAENYTVSGEGGGTAVLSQDADGNPILTLTNYVYTGAGHNGGYEGGAIDFRCGYDNGRDLIIVLVGNNTITKADDSGIRCSHGIYFASYEHSLIIDGTGSLTISFSSERSGSKSNGIFCEPGAFVMNGGTVVSNAGVGDESAGIYTSSGITFNGGSFTGNGNYTTAYASRGIYSDGTITINDGTVCGTAPLDNGAEARAFDNSMVIINGGTVTAYGQTAFQWPEYNVQCGSNSTWTILAGDDENSATEVSSLTDDIQYVHIVAHSGDPVTEYDLYIAGVRVTSANLSGEGWSYDPDTNTLTLNNFTYEGEGSDDSRFWRFNSVVTYAGTDTFYLIIEGTNSITNTKNDYDNVMALLCTSDMTIGGNGSLILNAPNIATNMSMGLCVDGKLLISGGAITANSGASEWRSAGICVFGMRFIQTGGSVIACADEEAEESYGLYVLGEAQVYNGAPREFTAEDVCDGITIGAGIKKLVAVGYTSALYTKGAFDFKLNATAWTDVDNSADGIVISAGEYCYDDLVSYKYIDFESSNYVSLDTDNKPDINVPDDKDEAEDGDEISVDTDATPITVKWYYDDDGDGIPDGEPIGEGDTYTVKCPDENDPDHDDTGHTIIAVITQDEDGNGDPYPDGQKPTVTSKPVKVEGDILATKWIIKMRAKSSLSISVDDIIKASEKIVRVYDVTLYRVDIVNGVDQEPVLVQPSDIGQGATITVKLTVPDALYGKSFRILHIHAADDIQEVVFTTDSDGKHITIRDVDRLSEFVFVAEKDVVDPGEGQGQSGQSGSGEQGQGGSDQGSGQGGQETPAEVIENEPEKEDDPTIDNWTLTPQGQGSGQGQGQGGQSGSGEQEQGEGGQGQGESGQGQGESGQGQGESGQGGQNQGYQKPAVTVALEDTEPQEGVTVEIEVKTDVSQEIAEADNSVLADRIQSDDEIAIVYEVKLIRITIEEGVEIREEIQPSDIKPGTVVVINMQIPEELRGKPFKLLHIHAEDDIKEITSYTVSEDGATLTVRVDRLSEFAFVGKKASEGDSGPEGSPYNGDFCPGWISVIFGLIVLALFITMVVLVAVGFSFTRKFLYHVGLIASGAVILAAVVIIAVHTCPVSAAGFGVCAVDALLFILYGSGEKTGHCCEDKPAKSGKKSAASSEVAATADNAEEGMTLKETLAMAATTTRSEKITKTFINEYLVNNYLGVVKLNTRENYTKTGLPLADTHFVTAADGKKVCFIYVFETNGATILLLKMQDALGEELSKDYKSVRKSAFPKAKDRWYSVVIDDSLTDEEVKHMIDRTIAVYTGAKVNKKTFAPIQTVKRVTVAEAAKMIEDEVATASIEVEQNFIARTGKKEIVNVDVLSKNYNDGDTVTTDSLREKGLVPKSTEQVKLLARGTLDKKLRVELQDFSPEAVKMIIATGGTIKKV